RSTFSCHTSALPTPPVPRGFPYRRRNLARRGNPLVTADVDRGGRCPRRHLRSQRGSPRPITSPAARGGSDPARCERTKPGQNPCPTTPPPPRAAGILPVAAGR